MVIIYTLHIFPMQSLKNKKKKILRGHNSVWDSNLGRPAPTQRVPSSRADKSQKAA